MAPEDATGDDEYHEGEEKKQKVREIVEEEGDRDVPV